MVYVAPTAAAFKLRFPEFSVVNNELVNLVLADSIGAVGESWLEKDRARAQMLLTAHSLSMEGEPQRSTALNSGGVVNNAAVGAITEMRDRDVQVKFSDKSGQVGDESGLGEVSKGFMQTQYGKEYYLLLRRNAPSAVAV